MSEENKIIGPIESTKKIEGRKIMTGQIKRNMEGTIEIKLQSSIDWKMFKRAGKDTIKIGNVECYYPRNDSVPGVKGFFYYDNVFENNDFPNLCLILAKEIEKGVTFVFNSYPISEVRIKNWIQKFNEQIKILYLSYCKPINISISITSEIVEREFHD